MDEERNLSTRTLRSASFNKPLATSSPDRLKDSIRILNDNIRQKCLESVIEEVTKLNELKEEIERAMALMMYQISENSILHDLYYIVEQEEIKQDENIDPEVHNKVKVYKTYSRKTKSNNLSKRKQIKRLQKNTENDSAENGKDSAVNENENADIERSLIRITRAKTRQMNSSATDVTNSSNQIRTPLRSRGNYKIAAVTPKPNISSTPATILRRPNPGEMAISLTGSPLMIASQGGPTMLPHVNIPLKDGRVMAVLGNGGQIDTDDFPELNDTTTLEQLQKLHQFLGQAITSHDKQKQKNLL